MPGWCVEGATLAGKGSLASALGAVPDPEPLVYPLFMADGWFVSTRLPQLVAETTESRAVFLDPLGTDPGVHALCIDTLRRSAEAFEFDPGETTILLAAHGSPSDPRPGAVARLAAERIAEAGRFRDVRVGFIDEEPALAQAARVDGPALCLPFFAARGGHVQKDVPDALAEASFPGRILDPVGVLPEIPELIAGALRSHTARLAA